MTAHNEPPHLNLQCFTSRFWFWCFMWWAWELSCSVLKIILFLIFLFIVFPNWTGHFIVTPDFLFHPLNHKYLDTKIIDIIVWKSDQHVSSMHTCTCQNADQMSNSKDHYQTGLWIRCVLFAQVYICPNIWGKNNVLSCSKCDKYNNFLIQVHCSNPK